MTNIYKKILTVATVGVFGITALVGGFSVVQAQIYSCMTLNYNLSSGMSGIDVTTLQQFLISQGYLATNATGYFGGATMTAVKAYQYAHDLPVNGIADATTRQSIQNFTCGGYNNTAGYNYNNGYYNNYSNGYYTNGYYAPVRINSLSTYSGSVGTSVTIYGTGFDQYNNTVNFGTSALTGIPSYNGTSLTFTVPAVNNVYCNYNYSSYSNCNYPYWNQYSGQNTYQVSIITIHGTSNSLSFTLTSNGSCGSYYYGGYYNNGYNNNCYNYPNQYQGAPTISNVSGPTSISTGSQGSWTISLFNPNYNSSVTTSVDWGDQYAYGYVYASSPHTIYNQGQQTLTFTHTYQNPGTYTIRFTVRDANGNQNSSTMTVYVAGNGYQYYY